MPCPHCPQRLRAERGCDRPAPVPWLDFEDGEGGRFTIDRCPYKLLTPATGELLRWYGFFQKGYLPDEGGLRGQAARFTEAVELIEAALAKQAIEDRERKGPRR